MPGERRLESNDLALWDAETRTVQPLSAADRSQSMSARPEVRIRQDLRDDPDWDRFCAGTDFCPVEEPFALRQTRTTAADVPLTPGSGMSKRKRKRILQGKEPPEDRCDLHGCRYDEAKRKAAKFLRDAQAAGKTFVLVITGYGSCKIPSGDGPMPVAGPFGEKKQGVIGQDFPNWVDTPEFAELVHGCEPAHRRHGGKGAFYVSVRKRSPR